MKYVNQDFSEMFLKNGGFGIFWNHDIPVVTPYTDKRTILDNVPTLKSTNACFSLKKESMDRNIAITIDALKEEEKNLVYIINIRLNVKLTLSVTKKG